MKKNVIIISNYLLLEGNCAIYERMRCYAKAVPGLSFICYNMYTDLGKPFCFTTHENNSNLYFVSGAQKKRSYLYRNLLHLFDLFSPLSLCKQIRRYYDNEEATILLYSTHFLLFVYVILFLRYLHGYKIVVEKNELERGVIANVSIPKGVTSIFFIFLLPLRNVLARAMDWLAKKSSVVIAISENLKNKYTSDVETVLVPVLVDSNRFTSLNEKKHSEIIRFAYLGAITAYKDGLFEIVEAFGKLKSKHNYFSVDIIGSGDKSVMERLKQCIRNNNLADQIFIKPQIESKQVPALLMLYDYGLLIRENNLQTQFGFSSKLGEYLMAGLPVIYTEVSDNSVYLKDRLHGFLVRFPLSLYLEITLENAVTINQKQRTKMGQCAKELALTRFDYSIYSKTLQKVLN